MHELSVAVEIARATERAVSPVDLGRIVSVGVEVGNDAGVEPSNLEFCLTTLLTFPPFAGARPRLARVPGDDLRLVYVEVDDGCADN